MAAAEGVTQKLSGKRTTLMQDILESGRMTTHRRGASQIGWHNLSGTKDRRETARMQSVTIVLVTLSRKSTKHVTQCEHNAKALCFLVF